MTIYNIFSEFITFISFFVCFYLILVVSIKYFYLSKKTALVIIDPQNDFCAGGTLAVSDAESIFVPINHLRTLFTTIFITHDWHPKNHCSFASTHGKTSNVPVSPPEIIQLTVNQEYHFDQALWPTHCVQGSDGAKLHPNLITNDTDIYIYKGTYNDVESYSGFGDQFNNSIEQTPLLSSLQKKGINDLVICGLATDYCLLNTVKDARRFGFTVSIIMSTTRGVSKDTTHDAYIWMFLNGVKLFETVEKYENSFK
jgi:nicotinamidase/pyrazinamidase